MSTPQLEFAPLLDWVEGRLSPEEAREMERLVATADARIHETITWLRRLLAARHAVRIADLPAPTHELLRDRFAAYVAGQRGPGVVQQIVATLSFDSLAQAVAAGTRTAGPGLLQPRQLIFSCTVADVALNVHRRPHDERIDLSGQVLTHGELTPAGWGVLLIGDRGPDSTRTDDLGEFSFEAVAPGEYMISLATTQLSITMPIVALVP